MNKNDNRKNLNTALIAIFVVIVLVIFSISNEKSTSKQNDQRNDKNTSQQTNLKPTLPEEDSNKALDADVRMVSSPMPGIQIKNMEKVDWKDCTFELNDIYKRTDKISFKAGENGDPFVVAYGQLTTEDGEKFNYLTTTPKKFWIYCEVNGISRLGGFNF